MSLYLGDKKVSAGVYIETDRVVLSAAEYEALEVKDPNTLYFIHDDPTLEEVREHITDGDVHVTAEEKEKWNTPQINTDDIANLHVWKYRDANGNVEYLTGVDSNSYAEGEVEHKDAYWSLGTLKNNLILVDSTTSSTSSTYSANCTYWAEENMLVNPDGSMTYQNSKGTTTINVPSSAYDGGKLLGKFIMITSLGSSATTQAELNKIYFIPSDAKFTTVWSNLNTVTVDKIYEVVGHPESNSGEYTYIGQLGDGGGAKIASGSYVGTGSANTLTFDFPPKFILIKSMVNSNNLYLYIGVWFYGDKYMVRFGTQSPETSLQGKTLSCTVSNNTATIPADLSISGYTHYYVAIG